MELNVLELKKTTASVISGLISAYKKQLASDGKIASGNLANNISWDITLDGTNLKVIFDLPEYWKYVEYGRKPGKFPPLDKIRSWIRVKPILPRPGANGKIPSENQLAFLISRKIATKGIKGSHSLGKAITSFNATQKILDAIAKSIADSIKL